MWLFGPIAGRCIDTRDDTPLGVYIDTGINAGLFPGRTEPSFDQGFQRLVLRSLYPNWHNALHVRSREIVIGELTEERKRYCYGSRRCLVRSSHFTPSLQFRSAPNLNPCAIRL